MIRYIFFCFHVCHYFFFFIIIANMRKIYKNIRNKYLCRANVKVPEVDKYYDEKLNNTTCFRYYVYILFFFFIGTFLGGWFFTALLCWFLCRNRTLSFSTGCLPFRLIIIIIVIKEHVRNKRRSVYIEEEIEDKKKCKNVWKYFSHLY